MRITLLNLTQSPILYHTSSNNDSDAEAKPPLQIALLPSSSTTTELPKRCTKLTLIPRDELVKHESDTATVETDSHTQAKDASREFNLNLKAFQRSNVSDLVEGSPWRMYRSKISRKHYKMVILPLRDLSSFLSGVPDTVPLSSLLLPGTHETMAFYGWPFSQCQTAPTSSAPDALLTQLHSGIRAIDIRLSIIDNKLVTFHGPYPQRTSFTNILKSLHQFLTTEGKSECIIVSVKQEDKASSLFSQLVQSEVASSPGGPDLWFTESNRIPTLGEVRGRCILFSRFGDPSSGGLGIHPNIWPDSLKEGFEWNCGDTKVRVSDWYSITSFLSIPEKVVLSTEILIPPLPPLDEHSLAITFFSASSIPLALPPTIARGFGWPKWGFGVVGVNERIGTWLTDRLMGKQAGMKSTQRRSFRFSGAQVPATNMVNDSHHDGGGDPGPRLRGWVFMDFYEDPVENSLVPLLVEGNFKGRKSGEEGWI